MKKEFDIQTYMTKGVEKIVAEAIKATLKNPKESIFMVKFAAASKAASRRRAELEKKGEHVPPFLIASITSKCNLHCEGCYSRCNQATVDTEPVKQLSGEEWDRIFTEAGEIGVSFMLLAGGEPLLRRDVIEAAGQHQQILFPIFTNGTFINDAYFELFDRARNLIPVMSIEGGREATDARRGAGIYDVLIKNMDEFKRRGLIFGASVTVTTANVKEVTSAEFVKKLADRGCKLVTYVEFVPDTEEAKSLAPGDAEREYMAEALTDLRKVHEDVIFIAFPGDEKSSGGCLAAGRGFFHINSHGGAEPCPFSPYSDVNIRQRSLLAALNSELFAALRDGDILLDDHNGGCVLHEKKAEVEAILAGGQAG